MRSTDLRDEVLRVALSDMNKFEKGTRIESLFTQYFRQPETSVPFEFDENDNLVTGDPNAPDPIVIGDSQNVTGNQEPGGSPEVQGKLDSDPEDQLGLGQNVVTK